MATTDQSLEVNELPQSEIDKRFGEIIAAEPKPVDSFVPADASIQKELFLKGEIRNPDHTYIQLAEIDFEQNIEKIVTATDHILVDDHLNKKFEGVYEEFRDDYVNKTRFMQLAKAFKSEQNPDKKAQIKAEYMALNVEIYGEPDEETYRSLLGEKIQHINEKDLVGNAAAIRSELQEMVGDYSGESHERFIPSQETVDWMQGITESLYGGMLSHVPEQESFEHHEIAAVLREILEEEFGEAARGWTVVIEKAQSIKVQPGDKKIIVPEGKTLDRQTLCSRIVHEIGVHFLRSVMGAQTDLPPFSLGLSKYFDSEEALGAIMEQALASKYKEAGVDHYIAAGLGYFDNKDFRETFEIKWRLSALSGLKSGEVLTPEAIEKAKELAYNGTMRSRRGTDELPWFKDLSYYNAVDTWKYIEENRGDDLMFMFLLLGKGDAGNAAHRSVMLETATV